ncbi:arginine--tRNA ligase [Candidatus Cyanaurora vandensis]|uniref:arginine--tRNA ligase n=1 Tax=Candidatus Cyanaurora vandensis TaxID=2714958 RepID=UPI002580C37C|nr:arginine--tRNA ligase [Candidatus Cyanaurora vandensis]
MASLVLSDLIQQHLHHALTMAFKNGLGQLTDPPELMSVVIEKPKNPDHGDYATPIALSLTKLAKIPPRALAQAIADHLETPDLTLSIAGPGFLNVHLSDALIDRGLHEVLAQGADYGRTTPRRAEKILLEFVSANPTGPLHVGHGRWAALGSAIANLLRFAGHTVTCEFYINDAGNQMNLLGTSLQARYRQALGEDFPMPEQGYQGSSIQELAQTLLQEVGDSWRTQPDPEFREYAYHQMLAQQEQTLRAFRTEFDHWFSERTLHTGSPSAIEQGVQALDQKGYLRLETTQLEDGSEQVATFFKTTEFGDDKDRVLKKSTGEYTYMAADIAYHHAKLQRGYDRLINILGADHHGYVPRLKAIVQAFGYPPDTLEVIIGQLVKLYRQDPVTGQKEEVRMSKRTGTGVTVDDLLYGIDSPKDAVGVDAARWYLLSQSADSPVTFDLDLAVKQRNDNLVFYAQYAHARTCSLERNAQEKGIIAPDEFHFLNETGQLIFTEPEERKLALVLLAAPEVYRLAAQERAPHRVVVYLVEVADLFNKFYDRCRVFGSVIIENPPLAHARWGLFRASQQVLANSLTLLGIDHPNAM